MKQNSVKMRKYGARSDHTRDSHFKEDLFVFKFFSYFPKPQKKFTSSSSGLLLFLWLSFISPLNLWASLSFNSLYPKTFSYLPFFITKIP